MIKAILFDLDGTLLPMDQNEFVKGYFGGICDWIAPYGYEPKAIVNGIWTATKAMIENDGSRLNEEVFWENFSKVLGEEILQYKSAFDEFYIEEFKKVKAFCGYNPMAREIIDLVKEKGFKVICATNPIFPKMATMHRMNFAGLSSEDFDYFTYYENSSFCKPNIEYYKQVLSVFGLKPEECIMVGNDVTEDGVAQKLGIKVFILTDCLINEKNIDINSFSNGDYYALKHFIMEQ